MKITGRKYMRSLAAIIVMTALMVSVCAPASLAASSKKSMRMTTYDVVKKGNTVYCHYNGIYKVDLKTKSVKKIVSSSWGYLHLHKGYLYYIKGVGGEYYRSQLCRLKLSSNKSTTVFRKKGIDLDYAIRGSKTYFSYNRYSGRSAKEYRYVAKLNGKGRKTSNVKVRQMKYKRSNAAGYRIDTEEIRDGYGDYAYSVVYLRTPDGRIELVRGIDNGEGIM